MKLVCFRGMSKKWCERFIVKDGNVYDEYDGTFMGKWDDFMNGEFRAGVEIVVCGFGVDFSGRNGDYFN